MRRWESDIKILFEVELDSGDGGCQQQHGEAPENGEVHDAAIHLRSDMPLAMSADSHAAASHPRLEPVFVTS